MSWRPTIAKKGTAPLHEKLADALEADIAAGRLARGARLPTQRELAYAIGVGIGSVTRAYTLAIQRGLIEARVGRGSFVASPDSPRAQGLRDPERIDLARNIPPPLPAERCFAETLGRVRRRPDLLEHLAYSHPAGMDIHRRAGAGWLGRTAGFDACDWQRLLVTGGAQEGMSIVLSSIAAAGETIMVEAATFFGIKTLCQQGGYRLQAVQMDQEGILPESLEKAAGDGSRILYLMPTLQNPTGRTMGRQRRADIAHIARQRKLWLIEDDIYSAFATQKPQPFASLLPEQTFYISSLSKVLSPGLRVGFVSAPAKSMFDRLLTTVRARSYAPATLGALIATEWIESGTADNILKQVRAEVAARTLFAKKILAERLDPSTGEACSHLWLPMPELEAERLTSRAVRAGIDITPPSAPIVDRETFSGLRLCIGGVRDRAKLEDALTMIANFLSDRGPSIEFGLV